MMMTVMLMMMGIGAPLLEAPGCLLHFVLHAKEFLLKDRTHPQESAVGCRDPLRGI